jgi:hypothetical protein
MAGQPQVPLAVEQRQLTGQRTMGDQGIKPGHQEDRQP